MTPPTNINPTGTDYGLHSCCTQDSSHSGGDATPPTLHVPPVILRAGPTTTESDHRTVPTAPRTVAMYAAAPHHGGRNDKLKFLYCYTIRQHSPPRPDADVGDCDGPLVRVVNARELAELIRPLVFLINY
jgi:hypothetical protein